MLLVRAGELLLSQRRGGYGSGWWHLPAGKLEADESVLAAAAREVEEEVGVRVVAADLRHVHTVHVNGSGLEPRIGLFFEACDWSGHPVNREPEKCWDIKWFALDALPDELIAYPAAGIHAYRFGASFCTLGWDAETSAE